jgi:hypothetical protein
MQHGYQCGMLWGATLAAGAQAYRLFGSGPQAEAKAILAARSLVESFHVRNRTINCYEITGIDKSSSRKQMVVHFLLKGGTISCMRMAAWYAREAFSKINSSLSETQMEVPSPPVSCSAMAAQKMGVSDMHGVMAAGFAGGIGLCGGACGALGAAIWVIGMKIIKEGAGRLDYKDPRPLAVVDRFLKCTDYEFECSKIVGRRFENIDDHADYLRGGGCSKIIDVLTAG